MVAYTTPDCLPYFTVDDSPCLNTGTLCDPSTVWCDFAALVDAQLDAFDEVVDRAATSVPLAWVETTTPYQTPVGTLFPVPFDTVRVDTANMVDLDLNSSAITVTRSGLYLVDAYATGIYDRLGASTGATRLTVQFVPGSTIPLGSGAATILFSSNRAMGFDLEQMSPAIQGVIPLAAGTVVVASTTSSGVSTDVLIFSKVMMSLAWTGDLP